MINDIKRGEIYLADLDPSVGFEQSGIRPVLIIQNDIGNMHSQTTIVACITSRITDKARMPTHVEIEAREELLDHSVVLLEQIRTIDKSRIIKKICALSSTEMNMVDHSLDISLCSSVSNV